MNLSEKSKCLQCGAPISAPSTLCDSCQTEDTLVGPGNGNGGISPSSEVSLPDTGSKFGDYELLEEIGRGGMGVVFRARHRKLDRVVAVKVILGGKFSSESDRQRLHFEAQAAAKLDHPAIIPVYDIAETDGQPYFAMKYVSGGSLQNCLDELRSDIPRAMSIISRIADAVHHAHQRGILHRDLKPDNILLDEHGDPLLTDLGLAKHTSGSSGITQTGALLGTPRHMAPEQAEPGEEVTTAADIYALGTVIYQLLTGRTPHSGKTAMETVLQVLQKPVDPPSTVAEKVDPSLELICMKCLNRDPDDRYRSAADLADDLKRWQSGEQISVRPPSFLAQAADWIRRNQPLVYAGLTLLAALLLSFPLFLSVLSSLPSPERLYEGTDADPIPWLYRLSTRISKAGAVFGPILLVVWMGIGLLIVVVARPPNLKKAGVYGLVAGSTSGAVMLALLGWAAFTVSSQAKTHPTIRMLATASLSSNPAAAREAKIQLEAAYPLLNAVPDNQRINYLSDRLFADGIAVGPNTLFATFLGLLVVLLPIVAGSMIGWSLCDRRHRWWLLLLRYGACQMALFVVVVTVIAALTNGNLNGRKIHELQFTTLVTLLGSPPAILAVLLHRWKKPEKQQADSSDF